jgi:purine-binding chemotaxis protein CheW
MRMAVGSPRNTIVRDDDRKQYIVVKIGDEQYGIDISHVDNIVRMQKITRVPKVQSYFPGIINLRGEVVPIMSIRAKMGLDEDTFTDATRIIILKVEEQGRLGIITDEVKEVVTLSADEIEKVAHDASAAKYEQKNNFINGIGKNGDELISLFDINSIIDEKEVI